MISSLCVATNTGMPKPVASISSRIPLAISSRIHGVFEHSDTSKDFYGRQLEAAAQKYETQLRPRDDLFFVRRHKYGNAKTGSFYFFQDTAGNIRDRQA
jgi:ornithine decarboxylase